MIIEQTTPLGTTADQADIADADDRVQESIRSHLY
jgi:hypothetical protein